MTLTIKGQIIAIRAQQFQQKKKNRTLFAVILLRCVDRFLSEHSIAIFLFEQQNHIYTHSVRHVAVCADLVRLPVCHPQFSRVEEGQTLQALVMDRNRCNCSIGFCHLTKLCQVIIYICIHLNTTPKIIPLI